MRSILGKTVALLLVGLGLLLVFAATQLLTDSLEFPNVLDDSRPDILRDMTPWAETTGDVDQDEEDYSSRTRRMAITEPAGAVTVQWQLSSTRDALIVRPTAAADLLTDPDAFVNEVGRVGFSASLGVGAWEALSGASPPDVVYGEGGTATTTVSSRVLLSEKHVLFSVHPSCAVGPCAVEVSLVSDHYRPLPPRWRERAARHHRFRFRHRPVRTGRARGARPGARSPAGRRPGTAGLDRPGALRQRSAC